MIIIPKKSTNETPKNPGMPPTTAPLEGPLSANAKLIADLVAQCLSEAPFPFEGFLWARNSQKWWLEKTPVSESTFRRCISKAPFVRECIVDPATGAKVTLLRLGKPGPMTKRHAQNILSKIWRTKTGMPFVRKQYGHFAGLVDAWGVENAPEIFKLVLNDVPAFMAGSKIEIAKLGDAGKVRYFKQFPPTSYILRFNSVGLDMFQMKQQATLSLKSGKWDDVPIPF